MATTYKQVYDSASKGNLAPIGNEIQKALPLQINPKSEEKALFIGGLAYCAVVDGSHWVIGCSEAVFFTHTEMFFLKKDDSGKWVKQPDVEKAWRTSYEQNDGCYALNLDGHAGAEAFVKALDGKFIDSDLTILVDDGDKVSQACKAVLEAGEDDEPDVTGVLSGIFLVLSAEEVVSQVDRKKNVVPHPKLDDSGKPLMLSMLPKVKTGKSNWGGGKAGFLASADRLKEILEFKANEQFEQVYNWYSQEPNKVLFALALTGVSVTLPSLPTDVTVAATTVEVTPKTEKVEEETVKKYSATDSIINFTKVYEKEKGTGDASLKFSNDAVECIDNAEQDDEYKQTLMALSEYTVNGKAFPLGVTKNKLNLTGSVFNLSLEELKELIAQALN